MSVPLYQHPDGVVTLDPLMERLGLYGTASLLGVEHRTVQRHRANGRTLNIDQARLVADLMGTRLREVWPQLASVDQGSCADRDDWEDHARCKGSGEDFHPDYGGQAAIEHYARLKARYCDRCPVQAECLEDALYVEERLGHDPHGLAGGKTASERKVLLRFRRDATTRKARG